MLTPLKTRHFFLIYFIVSCFLLLNASFAFARNNVSSSTQLSGKISRKIISKSDVIQPSALFSQGTVVKSLPPSNQSKVTTGDAANPKITAATPNPCALFTCQQLTLSGENFSLGNKLYVIVTDISGSEEKILEYPAFDIINDQTIIVHFEGAKADVDFTAQFIVYNPDDKLASIPFPVFFSKYIVPLPQITAVEPNPLNFNLGVTELVLTGKNFTNNMTIAGDIIHPNGDKTPLTLNNQAYVFVDPEHIKIPLSASSESIKMVLAVYVPDVGPSNFSEEITIIGQETPASIHLAPEIVDMNTNPVGADGKYVYDLDGIGFDPISQVVIEAEYANGTNAPLNFSSTYISPTKMQVKFDKMTVDAVTVDNIVYFSVKIVKQYTESNTKNAALVPAETKLDISIPSTWDLNSQNSKMPVNAVQGAFKSNGLTDVGTTVNNQEVVLPFEFINPQQLLLDLSTIDVVGELKVFVVTNPYSNTSGVEKNNFTPFYPTPELTSVPQIFDLNIIPMGPGGLYPMTIEGTNFDSTHGYALKGTITSNGISGSFNLPLTYVNSTTLSAKIPSLEYDTDANLYIYDTTSGKSSNTKTVLFKAPVPIPSVIAPSEFHEIDGLTMDIQINNCTVNPCQLSGQMNLEGDMTPLTLPTPFIGNLVPVTLPLLEKNQTAIVTIVAKNSYDKGESAETLVYAPEDSNQEPLEAGDIVAVMEMDRPIANEFILHGAIPLPKGLYPTLDGSVPFGVVDYDDTVVPAQVDIVTRFPDSTDGASVVEISARVHRDPSELAAKLKYNVVMTNYTPLGDLTDTSVLGFLKNTPNLPSNLKNDILKEGSLVIKAEDFESSYSYSLDIFKGYSKIMRGNTNGDIRRTIRTYDVLTPSSPTMAAYSHLQGVFAYVTTSTDSDVLLLDMRVVNASNGMDKTTAKDDVFNEMFFKYLRIENVPAGWAIKADVEDPYTGYLTSEPNNFYIVKPLTSGNHYMDRQAQFHRRYAIYPIGKEAEAEALLRGEGLAFNIDAKDAEGNQYFSWWNKNVAAYAAQRHALPNYDTVGVNPTDSKNKIQADLKADYDEIYNALKLGIASGDDIVHPVLGWAHSYNIDYGGKTSGEEMHITEGLRTAYAGSKEGLKTYEMLLRMYASRQRVFFVDQYGNPNDIEQHLMACPKNPSELYQNAEYDILTLTPTNLDESDPFGFQEIDEPWYEEPPADMMPYYYDELKAIKIIDNQHLFRYLRNALVLVYLNNDPIAKDEFEMEAQNIELTYTTHPKKKWDNTCINIASETLRAHKLNASANPGTGIELLNRDEAWVALTMATQYSIADDNWRNKKRYWFDAYTDIFDLAQIDCTGLFRSQFNSGKILENHQGTQQYEEYLLKIALTGILKSVYDGADEVRADQAKDVLVRGYYPTFNPPLWNVTKQYPWSQIATANIPKTVMYCPDTYDYPADSHDDGTKVTGKDYLSIPGYAYDLTGDIMFIEQAAKTVGASPTDYADIEKKIMAKGGDKMFDTTWAYTLRIVQELMGKY
jgi:hypothetical protein